MKPDKPKLKEYQVSRVETRAYVYKIKAKNEDEAQSLVRRGYGEKHPELDRTVDVFYQVD